MPLNKETETEYVELHVYFIALAHSHFGRTENFSITFDIT